MPTKEPLPFPTRPFSSPSERTTALPRSVLKSPTQLRPLFTSRFSMTWPFPSNVALNDWLFNNATL